MDRQRWKGQRLRVLGAMSGTSYDGVDAAVIETDGTQVFGFGPSMFRPYSDEERAALRAAMGRWDGPVVDAAARVVDAVHFEVLSQFEDIDLIGFHGQTLAHDPRGRGTLQIGDGAALSQALGVPVVWDFRTTDVKLGGQGAPLAPFYHHACAKRIGSSDPIAFLNLGGVGNLTWVDPRFATPDDAGALLAFDTGPANAPIDDVMRDRFDAPFDRDGLVARTGKVDAAVITETLALPYFQKLPPKSLDRDAFASIAARVSAAPPADAVATLTALAAACVAQGMEHCPTQPSELLVTGGGRHNPVLMKMLSVSVDCPVKPIEDTGFDGDMLEAQAFAYLAARVAQGRPTSAPGTTGVRAAVGGGTLSMV